MAIVAGFFIFVFDGEVDAQAFDGAAGIGGVGVAIPFDIKPGP